MLDFCQNSSGCSNVAILHLEYFDENGCVFITYVNNNAYVVFDDGWPGLMSFVSLDLPFGLP